MSTRRDNTQPLSAPWTTGRKSHLLINLLVYFCFQIGSTVFLQFMEGNHWNSFEVHPILPKSQNLELKYNRGTKDRELKLQANRRSSTPGRPAAARGPHILVSGGLYTE